MDGSSASRQALDPALLSVLSDAELSGLAETVAALQRERAVAQGDEAALIEEGFANGFDSKGQARDPWMRNGVLICPGVKRDSGALSHRCSFVSVEGSWVWECADVLADDVRHVVARHTEQRSVTLVAAHDGLEFDVVASKARGGAHERTGVRSFVVRGGSPVLVNTRSDAGRVASHR
jgi:hypothetical protein